MNDLIVAEKITQWRRIRKLTASIRDRYQETRSVPPIESTSICAGPQSCDADLAFLILATFPEPRLEPAIPIRQIASMLGSAERGLTMEQTSTGLLLIGWKLVLAVIAGSGLMTTLGVYLLGRFTSVFDAYADERARLLAQFHNLDHLVEQTEKLTATAETIKARISDEVWDRQMRWKYLRDTYEKLMESLARIRISQHKLRKYQEIYHSSPSSDSMAERRLAEVDENANALADFLRTRDTAFLALSTEVHAMLQSVVSDLRSTHSESWDQDSQFNIALVERAILLVRQAGRKDLGYDS